MPLGDHEEASLHPGMRFEVRSDEDDALIRTGRYIADQSGFWRVPAAGSYTIRWLDDDGAVLHSDSVTARPAHTPDPADS